jgi:hypothetical protein
MSKSKPKAQPKKEELNDAIGNISADDLTSGASSGYIPQYLDCTAYTVECVKVNGFYNNFRILTLKIVAGVVVDIQKSDAYASFEFIDQLNVITDKACQSLNMHWENGKCL